MNVGKLIRISLHQAMRANLKIFRDRTLVPNCFQVYLPIEEFHNLSVFHDNIGLEIREEVQHFARQHGYEISSGNVIVDLRAALTDGEWNWRVLAHFSGESEIAAETGTRFSSGKTGRRKIAVVDKAVTVTDYELTAGSYVIGRWNDADLVIDNDDLEVSRSHCELRVARDGLLEIRDLASLNGTLVNDLKISGWCQLHMGDRIRIGSTPLEVVL